MALARCCWAGLLLTTPKTNWPSTQEHKLSQTSTHNHARPWPDNRFYCISTYVCSNTVVVHFRCLVWLHFPLSSVTANVHVSDILALPDIPDRRDPLLHWQRVNPSKPLPSLTTSGAHPESCPSRRALPCYCISGHRKTGGRDGTMASMAWCHTNILLSKMCEYFILDMTQMGEISKNHVECDLRFNNMLPILCIISKCVIKATLLYL